MAFQCRGDDQTVGRVGMEIGKTNGADGDGSVDGNLRHALLELLPAPTADILPKSDTSLVLEQCYFPERNRRDADLTGLPWAVDLKPGLGSQPSRHGRTRVS